MIIIVTIISRKENAFAKQELFGNLHTEFLLGAFVDAVPYHREAPRVKDPRDLGLAQKSFLSRPNHAMHVLSRKHRTLSFAARRGEARRLIY